MDYGGKTYELPQERAIEASFFATVFGWMAFALALTGITAYVTANNQALLSFVVPMMVPLLIGELLLVIGISWGIRRISAAMATGLFIVYAIVNGLTLSIILLAYTQASVATAFFVTSGTFAVMCAYGYYTKRDLTSLGSLAFMALFGLIIGSVVNIFLANETMYWILSYAGVLIFVGLTAFHAQRIKIAGQAGFEDGETERKAAIMLALALYLDFINLFLYLLRILGRRR
jgi:FtsH-binding integral membrane protein